MLSHHKKVLSSQTALRIGSEFATEIPHPNSQPAPHLLNASHNLGWHPH
jgi:hypothetical protein